MQATVVTANPSLTSQSARGTPPTRRCTTACAPAWMRWLAVQQLMVAVPLLAGLAEVDDIEQVRRHCALRGSVVPSGSRRSAPPRSAARPAAGTRPACTSAERTPAADAVSAARRPRPMLRTEESAHPTPRRRCPSAHEPTAATRDAPRHAPSPIQYRPCNHRAAACPGMGQEITPPGPTKPGRRGGMRQRYRPPAQTHARSVTSARMARVVWLRSDSPSSGPVRWSDTVCCL